MKRLLRASIVAATALAACTSPSEPARESRARETPRNLLIITIDTLRADRVGAYGYGAANTPAMDGSARGGVRFTRAYAPTPITLPSHASLLTGRYPPGHGSRHNGIPVNESVPTLATALKAAGFATAAFVSAFPLDRRFGLARGFDVYDDELPRSPDGKPMNERAGMETVRRARAWLDTHRGSRFFLWVHLFEPHAPYGEGAVSDARPVGVRYDEEVAAADRAAAALLTALGDASSSTVIVFAGDHGEAFGERGEIGHSIFVYDTTLRVPLIVSGPGMPAGREADVPVSLVDVAPTVAASLGIGGLDADGVSLSPLWQGNSLGDRTLYAESYAPLFDFGWSPLRSVRDGRFKYIAAPKPELYDVVADGAEARNLIANDPQRAARMLARVESYGAPASSTPAGAGQPQSESLARLRALGYFAGSSGSNAAGGSRPDPKDRIALASRIAAVTSGEVTTSALIPTLEGILHDDPGNPQAHLRLGYAELERGRCDRAEPHFRAALDAAVPSADAGLGLADCRLRVNDTAGAERALQRARAAEPGNPVVDANLGLVALARNENETAVTLLRTALARDNGLLQARFALARALARTGRRQEALTEAETLLSQLSAEAPQRREVQRLIDALR